LSRSPDGGASRTTEHDSASESAPSNTLPAADDVATGAEEGP